uniref:Uncharacterized protein n=1 Tax=Panagrolaimus superbus TaxID=310955 RepID=A0A914YNG7_9BILA
MSLHTGIRPSTSSSARLSVSDSSVLSQQQSHKPLSFRTIPSGRRPLTRTDSDASISSSHHKPSTLRLSRTPSTRSNSNSSVSSNRRMPTTQAPLRPSLSSPNIPFQISLNLVMKVQPIDEKYSMEPIGLRLNDVNILPPKTVRQQPFQQRQRSFSHNLYVDQLFQTHQI